MSVMNQFVSDGSSSWCKTLISFASAGKIRREVRAIGLPQARYEGIAVLTRDLPILVTVTVVEAELQFMFSCIAGSGHSGFLWYDRLRHFAVQVILPRM